MTWMGKGDGVMAMTDGWTGQVRLEFDQASNAMNGAIHGAMNGAMNGTMNGGDGTPLDAGERGASGTRLRVAQAQAPLKVQRPFYPEGDSVCHCVLVHTAGGMVGGDRLNISITAAPVAQALVTTAAASKIYRSTEHPVRQSVQIRVGAGGCVEWLPQELILFNGANYQQHLTVELDVGAVWMGWEIARLGRTVRGERFEAGEWRSHTEVWHQGRPIWIDPQRIQGGSEMLTQLNGLANCPVVGTFALVGVDVSDDQIEQARACWQTIQTPVTQPWQPENAIASIGVSQLQSGLICRYRGVSTLMAQRWFMAVWDQVRRASLARPSSPPRVWQVKPSVSCHPGPSTASALF